MSHMNRLQYAGMMRALEDVGDEVQRVFAERGQQELLDGRGIYVDRFRDLEATARHMQARWCAWADVLVEEVSEAMRAEGDANLRAELVQAGNVIVQWIAAIDRRTAAAASGHGAEGSGKGSAEIVAPAGAGCVGWDGDGREVVEFAGGVVHHDDCRPAPLSTDYVMPERVVRAATGRLPDAGP